MANLFNLYIDSDGYGCPPGHELTPEQVAEVSGWDLERVRGMLGPETGIRAGYTYDADAASPEDFEWPDGDNTARYSLSNDWTFGHYEGVYFPEELAEAFRRIDDTISYSCEWDEDRRNARSDVRAFYRYARLLGYEVRHVTLTGVCQGDWADMLFIAPVGDDTSGQVETWRTYFAQEVYYVTVESYEHSFDDAVGGVYGDDAAHGELRDMVRRALEEISEEIIETKKACGSV